MTRIRPPAAPPPAAVSLEASRREPSRERASALLALAAVTALAMALRLWNVRHGLPDFLEEAIPFKRALAMWGWETGHADLNPHFFNYPSLSLYVHFLVQKLHYAAGWLLGRFQTPADYRLLIETDPTAAVVAARLVGVAADVAAVAAAACLAEKLRRGAGLWAGLLAALAPSLLLTARSIYSDTLMVAAGAWALERMLAWREEGRRAQLATAIVLIGLAAGAKYPGGTLVLPLAWVMWERQGWRGLLRWPAAAAGAALIFLATSPYVLLDFRAFWTDFAYEGRHLAGGHLGTQDRLAAWFHLKVYLRDLGWLGGALPLWSLATLVRPGPQRGAVAAVWLAMLPHLLGLSLARLEAQRYLLPVLPAAAALAAWAALDLRDRLAMPRRWRPWLPAAVVLPVLLAGLRAAAGGADSTQLQARRWCEANLSPQALLVQEAYGAALRNSFMIEEVQRAAYFRSAGTRARARLSALPQRRAVVLPMAVSGRIVMRLEHEQRDAATLVAFDHASEFNHVFYDPRLFLGVDYFLGSAAVGDRYRRDPARYPVQNRWYDLLAATAEVAAEFRPGGRVTGPAITIYRLGETTWRAIAEQFGSLDPHWWANGVPLAYRQAADAHLVPPAQRSGGALLRPDGRLAAWALSLREPFETYVLPFAIQLAQYLAELDRCDRARVLAGAVLLVKPEEAGAALLYSYCTGRLGDWEQAAAAASATLQRLERSGGDSPALRLEYARALVRTGSDAAARGQLLAALAGGPVDSATAAGIQTLLRALGGPPGSTGDAPAP